MATLVLVAVSVAGLYGLRERSRELDQRTWPGGPLGEALRLLLEEQRQGARAVLQEAVEDGDPEPALYLALGALLRSEGEPDRAAALHRGLTVRPGLSSALRAEAHRQVALDLLVAERYSEAAEAAQSAVALLPDDPFLLAMDRDTAYESGDLDRALGAHYRWVKLTGKTAGRVEACLLVARAVEAQRVGEQGGVKRELKRAAKVDADNPHALYFGARAAQARGHWDEAVVQLKKLDEMEPGLESLVLPELAQALQRAGKAGELDEVRERAAAVADQPLFACGACGHRTQAVAWRCRSCGVWASWQRGDRRRSTAESS